MGESERKLDPAAASSALSPLVSVSRTRLLGQASWVRSFRSDRGAATVRGVGCGKTAGTRDLRIFTLFVTKNGPWKTVRRGWEKPVEPTGDLARHRRARVGWRGTEAAPPARSVSPSPFPKSSGKT